MRRLCVIFSAFLLLFPVVCSAGDKPEPRILIGLYDSDWESTPRPSLTHRFMEMPANHLGYDIHYYDIRSPLPKIGDDVAGIIIWFDAGTSVPDPKAYLSWLEDAVAHGKKLIVIENNGLSDKVRQDPSILKRWNNILRYMGMHDDNRWSQITYDAHISYIDNDMVGFERKIKPPYAPLAGLQVINGSGTTSHLRMVINRDNDEEIFDLVSTGPQGGYIAPGYALLEEDINSVTGVATQDSLFLWFVNPFTFLRQALNVQVTPIPDATTLDGKRIFYTQIDGDGWNNVSEIPPYFAHNGISAEVIYDRILKPYSDFIFNVALITADVDVNCYGVKDSERIAKEIFALPNVEPSSHTYSHPLFWEFFEHYTSEMEAPYLHKYPPKPGQKNSLSDVIKNQIYDAAWPTQHTDSKPELKKPVVAVQGGVKRGVNEESLQTILDKYYDTPRSYACSPFNLEQEIKGSAERINALSPPDKKVKLIQWSGDTSPFEAALAMTRTTGLLNINGGNSRFDREYPSYSYVAPIGIKIGNERQIYSSNSNEDTYTDLWTDRFFGYRYMQTTVNNTGSPIRISPFNIYFHIFSGEKQASLNAIKEDLEYARKQNLIHISASEYSTIAQGFYSAEITKSGDNSWKIDNRGNLQTVRFDNPGTLGVDFASSKGVIGEQLFQNSLYVALDPRVKNVLLALKDNALAAHKCYPYLVESTWHISNVRNTDCKKLIFDAQGYGPGSMTWKVLPGAYLITINMLEKHILVAEDGLLSVTFGAITATDLLTISIDSL